MAVFLRSLPFFFALVLDWLRWQLLAWPQYTRPSLRRLLLCLFTAGTMAFFEPFHQLPRGWFGAVCDHLFTVPGAFVASMLTLFFVAGVGANWLAIRVARTL